MSIFSRRRKKKTAADYPGAQYPETCAVLWNAGIDPSTITEDGLSYAGYETFWLDPATGRKTVIHDRVVNKWNQWEIPDHKVREIMDVYLTEKNLRKWDIRK